MKKPKTDLDKFRKFFGEIELKVSENRDEYDFTEFLIDDIDKEVEFYFDKDGKFIGITKVKDKLLMDNE